jgi:hypothetical protein
MTPKNTSLPSGLEDYAKSRTSSFVSKLKQAMALIESEVEQNEGLYPFNAGRLTKAELCRRAHVDDQTLQNKTHKATTNKMVDEWIENVKGKISQGKFVVRRAVTERAEHWKREHARIANAYTLAELEHNERLIELAALGKENEELKQEILELREMLSRANSKNIASIRPKEK